MVCHAGAWDERGTAANEHEHVCEYSHTLQWKHKIDILPTHWTGSHGAFVICLAAYPSHLEQLNIVR